jgi:transcriptional regulator with XRE-family HTH domain
MRKPKKKPIHPYLIALGSEIKRLRVNRKLSLEALGSDIGLDAANLQKIENGQNLTLNTLLKLAICLKTPPSKLLDKVAWNLNEKDLDALTTIRSVKKGRGK